MNLLRTYGKQWPASTSQLDVEMYCVRHGVQTGVTLSQHYEHIRHELWPSLDDHRWNSLCRDQIMDHKVSVLMGPASTCKTHVAAWLYLVDYYLWPEITCVLVSSTTLDSLDMRIWAEIKMLDEMAKKRFPDLPGHLIEYKRAISTDDLDAENARDFRKGIRAVPCVQNGKFVGLSKYIGIKQRRLRLVADEGQFMGPSFLSAFANLDKNPDFRATILGNPNDPLDPLGRAAEPIEGWSQYMDCEKTTVWRTKFMNGVCVNLIGTDSPNFDYPPEQPDRFPYMISARKIENTLSFFPRESYEFRSQCIGNMGISTLERRVLTRDLCYKFKALESFDWSGKDITRIGALDAAYGGDRCVAGHIEFGQDVNGTWILRVVRPKIVPIRSGSSREPMVAEDEIAQWVKHYCEEYGIPSQNFYHDSTGRGSLGTALARVWSATCNPVEFGGTPTARPVSMDWYVIDPKTGQRRLLRCDEHYRKFVTELWFSVRYCIEAGQMRCLPEDVMDEGCMREWRRTTDDKIELESKEEMKERVGRSPDLMDWLAIAVEGARRRGFVIQKLANPDSERVLQDYLQNLAREAHHLHTEQELNYEAA